MYWWGRILVRHSQLLLIKMALIQQFNLPIISLEVDYWMQLLQISCNRSMLFWPFRRVIIEEVTNIVFALLSLLSMLPLAMFWYVNLQLYSLPFWNLLEYIGDNNLGYCLYTHTIQQNFFEIKGLLLTFQNLKWLSMVLCVLNELTFLCVNFDASESSADSLFWWCPAAGYKAIYRADNSQRSSTVYILVTNRLVDHPLQRQPIILS